MNVSSRRSVPTDKQTLVELAQIRDEMAHLRVLERLMLKCQSTMLQERYDSHCARLNVLINGDKYVVPVGRN